MSFFKAPAAPAPPPLPPPPPPIPTAADPSVKRIRDHVRRRQQASAGAADNVKNKGGAQGLDDKDLETTKKKLLGK